MQPIYHITDKLTLTKAREQGVYNFCALATDGFIHASTREQVLPTANRFFKGQSELLLLEIDPSMVKAEIKYEVADLGPEVKFPHIYGNLNLDAITAEHTFELNDEGQFIAII